MPAVYYMSDCIRMVISCHMIFHSQEKNRQKSQSSSILMKVRKG